LFWRGSQRGTEVCRCVPISGELCRGRGWNQPAQAMTRLVTNLYHVRCVARTNLVRSTSAAPFFGHRGIHQSAEAGWKASRPNPSTASKCRRASQMSTS